MWKQHDLRPPPAPDPPDVSQEDPDKGVISVSGVVEERTLALELCQSQCTSTYEASTNQHPTPKSDFKAASWEPPEDARTENLQSDIII